MLLPWTREKFPLKPDAAGCLGIPTKFKLLGVLRALGRSAHFDDLAEDANCGDGGEALWTFFHKWCEAFAAWGVPIHVKPPDENDYDAMKECMRLYAEAGLDGCICSIDGVHFRWDRTTYSLKNTHVGKAGYPTRGYQIALLHNRYIIAVSDGFDGACNYKTQLRFNDLMNSMRRGERFRDIRYNLFQLDGTVNEGQGVWVLCDGGYLGWPLMQYISMAIYVLSYVLILPTRQ